MGRYRRGETVVLHPAVPGPEDIYGNSKPVFGNDVERPNCAVAPRVEVEEVGNNRSMVVNGFEESVFVGKNRARASVITATYASRRKQSKDNVLQRALYAGRD